MKSIMKKYNLIILGIIQKLRHFDILTDSIIDVANIKQGYI